MVLSLKEFPHKTFLKNSVASPTTEVENTGTLMKAISLQSVVCFNSPKMSLNLAAILSQIAFSLPISPGINPFPYTGIQCQLSEIVLVVRKLQLRNHRKAQQK